MERFPFPFSLERRFPKIGGYLVKIPSFFSTVLKAPYEHFLATLPKEEKPVEDPHGFTVMPFQSRSEWIIICGVRVDGYFSRKKTKTKIGKDFNPIFPLDAFVDVISKQRIFSTQLSPSDGLNETASESHEFVMVTMHEIRRLNLQIKAQSEEIIANLDKEFEKEYLSYRAQNIFGTSSLISTRLDVYDFHLNPQAFTSQKRRPIAV